MGLSQSAKIESWKEDQLITASQLASVLNDSNARMPVIYDIGPAGKIKWSVYIGSAKEKGNLKKFKKQLKELSKDRTIVIYCGCCPFDKCPNIRPAFELLDKLNFTNHKILNLPHNIKADWIDKGYPMNN